MNQEFKLQYDLSDDDDKLKNEVDIKHKNESSARNVCFVQLDGKMLFLNYGYLVSSEYEPEENIIILHFTSHTITLKGAKLDIMYMEFFNHIPKIVTCLDQRYNATENEKSVVNEIEVEKI